ncbi:MAG: hypothetical protein VX854_00165 [Candidatus Thermoplasmatota archaeon]|nr:hypothetical protein [Candidatus Thermoplasmatota archaeon]
MATRARIALELKDGSFISSYQHWDGYPGGLGYTLCDHWNKYDKVKEGIELGDASKWGMIVGEKVDFDDRDNDVHDVQNVYYGRDRGEKDVGYRKHLNGVCLFDEAFDCGEEYLYVFKETKDDKYEWFYVAESDPKNIKPLMIDAMEDHIRILKYSLDSIRKGQMI